MTDDSEGYRRENARLQSEVDRLHEKIDRLDARIVAERDRYERLRRRRVVRWGLTVADAWARVRPRRGRQHGPVEAEDHRTPGAVVAKILELRANRHPESGPLVRIVVLTRNGRDHLEQVLVGLDSATTYQSFEVVIVDNDSTDGSERLYDRSWGFPLSVIRNPTNVSFSQGCNQGAEGSAAPYLLFLNNDIVPITPEWLGAMVSSLEGETKAVAAGAVLVYPEGGPTPLTVQHRGIGFRHVDGVPLPENLGGDDPTSLDLVANRWVPAATAACLMVRAPAFREVGGFDGGYVYGFEDVDLCMRLREVGGSVLIVGDAVLFHHESATQELGNRSSVLARRRSNRMRFLERWAPTLTREIKLEAAAGGGGSSAPHLRRKAAITLTADNPSAGWGDWYTAHELGDALEREGWEILYAEAQGDHWYDMPDDVSLVISLLDRFDVSRSPTDAVKVAWVRNWTDRWTQREWFSRYDAVLPSSGISSRLVLEAGATPPDVVPLATNPSRFHPRPENVSYRGDYTFAGHYWGADRSLVDQLEVAPGERFTIYGKGWGEVPRVARYWRGALPYDELPELYSSSKVVLDDTAGPTLPYGAVNSRVFDALACGALVISNNRQGSIELFDGLLPTYESNAELRALLDHYLTDDADRERTAEALRTTVLDSHTYSHRAREIPELAVEALNSPRIAIKIGPPDHETEETWGDTHFARSFAKSLRRLGWRTQIDILPEWDLPDRQLVDVALHVRGLRTYAPKPGHVNALWVISHPDDVNPEECERFDVVFVASDLFAEELRSKVDTPVHVLWQATDSDLFRPMPPNPELATEVLFVGNSRKQRRPLVAAALAAGLPVDIYGSGWEGLVPDEVIRAEYFPNHRLAELYSSAKVVLNDHWPDMAAKGFISNRVFDAVASGALVVSDTVVGLDGLFQPNVVTLDSLSEIGDVVRSIVKGEAPADRISKEVTQDLRANHSFDARATTFTTYLAPLLAAEAQSVLASR